MALCAKCTGINLEDGLLYGLDTVGSMKRLAENGCAGCEFFLKSAERHLGWERDDPDGTDIVLYLRRIGRIDNRVDLRFSICKEEDKWKHKCKSVPLRLCSTYGFEPAFAAEYEGENEHFLGRVIAKNSGDSECIDLASAWMERCSRLHGRFCYPQADVPLPTRLLYIPGDADQKLELRITKGLVGRYVALSYCWGDGNAFMTNRDTFEDRQFGFEAKLLPQTLQDAIFTARKLGFHYIWIDALCIIQGDAVDWAYESSKMAEVYGNSSLTICADVSSKGEGIFRTRDSIRSHNFGSDDQFCLQTRGLGWQTMAAVPPYNPLSSRGWAFQERFLSQRMLHFLKEQIAWECRATLYMEESRCHQSKPKSHFSIRQVAGCLPSTRANEGKELTLKSQLGGWCIAYGELTVRKFTYPSDRLLSLSGLASAIETPQLGKYLAGVWENFAFSCMVWFPRYSQPVSGYRAPSWSWASFEGQLMDFWVAYEHYYPEDLDDTIVAKIMKEWDLWASQFHPQLLDHHIIYKSMDIRGEVLEGSYLVVRGCCRAIYVMDDPNTPFDAWEGVFPNRFKGKSVYMDNMGMRKKCKSVFAFEEELLSLDAAIELKKHTCILIGRERALKDPKTLGLVLAQVSQKEDTFRRVGIAAFDQPRETSLEESMWERQSKWKFKTFRLV